MRWQDLKDSNLSSLQFMGLCPSVCTVGGRGHVVGDEQNEVSNAEKCQKKTQVPQWHWNVSEIKTLLCIYRSGFVPAQAKAFRAGTCCGFVLLVPLFPFKKLICQLYFRRISEVSQRFHSCLLARGGAFQLVV